MREKLSSMRNKPEFKIFVDNYDILYNEFSQLYENRELLYNLITQNFHQTSVYFVRSLKECHIYLEKYILMFKKYVGVCAKAGRKPLTDLFKAFVRTNKRITEEVIFLGKKVLKMDFLKPVVEQYYVTVEDLDVKPHEYFEIAKEIASRYFDVVLEHVDLAWRVLERL